MVSDGSEQATSRRCCFFQLCQTVLHGFQLLRSRELFRPSDSCPPSSGLAVKNVAIKNDGLRFQSFDCPQHPGVSRWVYTGGVVAIRPYDHYAIMHVNVDKLPCFVDAHADSVSILRPQTVDVIRGRWQQNPVSCFNPIAPVTDVTNMNAKFSRYTCCALVSRPNINELIISTNCAAHQCKPSNSTQAVSSIATLARGTITNDSWPRIRVGGFRWHAPGRVDLEGG